MTKSWGSRIISALWGVLLGVVLIVGAIYLVLWNEGRGLHVAQSYQQAHDLLVTVEAAPIQPSNDLLVVHLHGMATTNDVLRDKLLDVSRKAIELNRYVEMYQWQESKATTTEKKYGGSEQEVTTYSYRKGWSSGWIDSASFKEPERSNPSSMPIQSVTQYAKQVTVGDFSLPIDLITDISGEIPVELDKVDVDKLSKRLKKPVQQHGSGLYVGKNPNTPMIGDMRVTMTVVLPQTVSVIAQQVGTSLQPFMAPAGEVVSLIAMGEVTPDEMIHEAEVQNRAMTWLLRAGSLLLMVLGFSMIMRPVVVLADVVPFFGNVANVGVGFVALLLGFGCWTMVVAVAWFAVRPLWSVSFVVVMGLIGFVMWRKKANVNTDK